MHLRFRRRVSSDIADGARWYEQERSGLGLEFSDAVYVLLNKVSVRPKIWPEIYAGVRRARLRRFPYAIYFRIEKGEIVVFLVFHTARNPDTLRRILRAREKPEA